MKKFKFLAVAAIVVAAVGTGVYASVERSNGAVVSDAVLANVEALADEEIVPGNWIVTIYTTGHWDCDPNGGVNCPGTPW